MSELLKIQDVEVTYKGKGLKKDWTVAQQDTLVHLLRSWRDASGWDNVGLLRRPQQVTAHVNRIVAELEGAA